MSDMLLNASISGGIVILLWYLSYPLSKKYFKASWHYAVLKITVIFMLVPISIFAPIFGNSLFVLSMKPDLPYLSEQIPTININAETVNSVNSALSEIVFSDVQYVPPSFQTENLNNYNTESIVDIKDTFPDIPYLQIIWLIVAIVLFSNRIRKMYKFKKQILNVSSSDVDFETFKLFLQCRKQLKSRNRINLRTSGYIKTPLAFGIIRPYIILPETGMDTEEKKLAIIHELTHIKNGDLWLKFLASVILAVHWFNPLAHLLRRKISTISEYHCDECVIKDMTKQERLIYGNLILKVASNISVSQLKFCSTLSAPTKNIKRRLCNMINFKKSRKGIIALSIIAAFFISSFAMTYAISTNVKAITEITVDVKNDEPTVYYNENFYSELKTMYNELISNQEFDGTFEDFLSEVRSVIEEFKELSKFEREKFYSELKRMYNKLISNQAFDGTFEDFLNEVRSVEVMFESFPSPLIIGMSNLNDFETFEELLEEFEELLKRIEWRNSQRIFDYSSEEEEFEELLNRLFEREKMSQERARDEFDRFLERERGAQERFELNDSSGYWTVMPWKESTLDDGRLFTLKNETSIKTGHIMLSKQDRYTIDLTNIVKGLSSTAIDYMSRYVPVEVINDVIDHLKSVALPIFLSRNDVEPTTEWNPDRTVNPNPMGLMITMQESIVRLANGIMIEAPAGTLIMVKLTEPDHEMEIIVGINSAVITQPDGISTVVPAGTIIDGEGNIIG